MGNMPMVGSNCEGHQSKWEGHDGKHLSEEGH